VSELPDGIEPAPIPEPVDAAAGIVLRRLPDRSVEVLLGRRARHARFMPGHLAFPGGKLEPEDEPERAGAFERCASRELREETGIDVPASAWRAAGERTTPPIFPKRFRTLFFVAELDGGARLPEEPPAPQEIEALTFADPGAALADWASGRSLVPPPLLPILRLMQTTRSAGIAPLAAGIAALNLDEDASPRIEFLPGVWVFPVRTRTLPPASCTNVWMPGGRRFIVIDPGSGEPGENARLLAVVAKRVAGGDAVHAIVLTHHHRDHVSGVGAIASALRVPVLAHPETIARIPALPGGIATQGLRDGDTIDLDGTTLRAMHTPGHAPGHLAFFDTARRVLFGGDLVSGLSTILVGPEDGAMDAYLDALAAVAALDPKTVLPSHGPPLPGKALAATIAHREARESGIVAALAHGAPRDLPAIAAAAYADAPDAPVFLRELQTRAHLRRLVRLGRIEEQPQKGECPLFSACRGH
jgi:glyoxylase-like metal-dependent hydrolase (beta-lactamase superfamily II)/8-oxo-dGTP pyrophosphatase MutT (NUDIX family)